jgi:plastocyanin
VRLGRRALFPVCALLGAGVAVLPAVAGSETSPSIAAENYEEHGATHHRWAPAAATVGENGVVTISNASSVPHGVEWVGGPTTPACGSGVPVGAGFSHSGTNWSGTCMLSKPGTYVFYCTVHGPEMTGTITVNASGTTTMTMTTGTTETTPSTTTSSTPNPSPGPGTTTQTTTGAGGSQTSDSGALGSLLAGVGSSAVTLGSAQHGQSVHGSINVSQAATGGRLEVELLARKASLASSGHPAQLQVGRLVRSVTHAGRATFVVSLDAKARRALRLHRRLALGVKIVLNPAHGSALTITRSVLLRD